MSVTEIQEQPRRHGKNVHKMKTLNEIYDWPWEVDIDLYQDSSDKVCFMSGKSREYFPEHPGFSRHGVEYSMNCHPGDVPNPSYVPSENRLQKPISLKGYGIGGLSAPRFPRIQYTNPNPKKEKRSSSKQAKGGDQERKSSTYDKDDKKYVAPETLDAIKRHKKELRLMEYHAIPALTPEQCKQRKLAFGSSTAAPRFAKDKKGDAVPGIGHYNVTNKAKLCKKVSVSTVFGSGPATINETTQTTCNFERFDRCTECLRSLTYPDYYKSLHPISIPQNYFNTFSTHAEFAQTSSEKNSTTSSKMPRNTLMMSFSRSSLDRSIPLKMGPAKHISFCRACYCDITEAGHEYWTTKRMAGKFMKARHCVNIHEHNNLPCFIHKVSCKLIRKLRRKEALMIKYFPDRCEKLDLGAKL